MKSKIVLLLPLITTIFGNFGSKLYVKEVSYVDNLVNEIEIASFKNNVNYPIPL